MIFSAFSRTLGQIGDPRFRQVLLLGVGLTIVLLVAATAAVFWLIAALTGDSTNLPLLGEIRWLGDLLSWTSLLVMLVLSVFLMIPVASAITSMFLEHVAEAVEARHYPHLPAARNTPISEALRDTLGFLGVLIGANLAAIFAYILLPFATVFIFWALNGYLLGREYFQLVAMRRIGRAQAKIMWRKNRITLWAAGILMAMPLSVPLLNLIIPILGAATYTHLYHLIRARAASSGGTHQYPPA